MESRPRPSSSDRPRPEVFNGSVYIHNLEQPSLSQTLTRARCRLACDDNGSVNLYIEERQGFDYYKFKLTHSIQELDFLEKTHAIIIILASRRSLEITLESQDQSRAFYDRVKHVHTQPDDTDSFPKHEPKSRIIKPEPSGQNSSLYQHLEDIVDLTRSSSPSDVDDSPSPTIVAVPSTSPVKKVRFRRASGSEQNGNTLPERSIQASSSRHSKEIQESTSSSSVSGIRVNESSLAAATPPSLSSKGSKSRLLVDVEQIYKKAHVGNPDRPPNSGGHPKEIQKPTSHSSPPDVKANESSGTALSTLSSKGTKPHLSVDIEQVYRKFHPGNSGRTSNSSGYSKDIQRPILCSSPSDTKASKPLSLAADPSTSSDKRPAHHAAELEQKVSTRDIRGPTLCRSPSDTKANRSPTVLTTSSTSSSKGTRPHLSVDIEQVYKRSLVEHSSRVPNSPNIHPKGIQGPTLCSSPSDTHANGSPALATVPSISPGKGLESRRVAGLEQIDNTRAEHSSRISGPHHHSKEIRALTPCSSPSNIKDAKSPVVAIVPSTPSNKGTKHHLSQEREQVCKKSRVEHSSRLPPTHSDHSKETQGPTSRSLSSNIKAGTSSVAATAPSTLSTNSSGHPKGIQKSASCGPPSDVRSSPYSAVATVPCTPPNKKSSPAVGVEQKGIKNRDLDLSSSPSDTKASSSAVATVPCTPTKRAFPRSTEELERAHKTCRVASSKPQFYSTVPTARVLRLINEETKKYGRVNKACKEFSSDRCIPAVLQAMFCLQPVISDLQGSWYQLWEEKQGLFRSLVDSVIPISKNRGSGFSEEIISDNVIKTRDGSLGDADDDAREFLNDTLNQVRQEFRERGIDNSCPLSRLFECRVDYTVECKECGNRSVHTENYQDFRLDVPTNDTTETSQETMSIGSLFPQVFDTQISFPCEACFSQSTTVDNNIAKLPHVLVVQLKRFTPQSTHGYSKNRNRVRIDGSLDFELFCSPEALSQDRIESIPAQYLDEDQLYSPHVPSDRLSNSWFSSASPLGYDDPSNPFVSFTEDDHTNGSHSSSLSSIPFALDGEEYSIETSTNRSYPYYEPPSEDEQYQWAMEESLRASQTLSQELILETRSSWDSAEDTSAHAIIHERQSDDEDPDLKAAILASLTPDTNHASEDKDDTNLLEWEERELEKAISQSLIDMEDNKENISPETPDGKKGKKGDKQKSSMTKSTGSSTPRAGSQVPASLSRASSVTMSSTDSDLRRKLKGKDKAPQNMRFGGPDESPAVFHLQAAVSHSDPEGRYICDCLGSDGIWRCCDDQMTTVGTLDDLNRHRSRSGYLLFYVRD